MGFLKAFLLSFVTMKSCLAVLSVSSVDKDRVLLGMHSVTYPDVGESLIKSKAT